MVPKESSTNQKRLPANAHAHRDVFQARLPWQEMLKLNKSSIFIITKIQFAIKSEIIIICNNQTARNLYTSMQK